MIKTDPQLTPVCLGCLVPPVPACGGRPPPPSGGGVAWGGGVCRGGVPQAGALAGGGARCLGPLGDATRGLVPSSAGRGVGLRKKITLLGFRVLCM